VSLLSESVTCSSIMSLIFVPQTPNGQQELITKQTAYTGLQQCVNPLQ